MFTMLAVAVAGSVLASPASGGGAAAGLLDCLWGVNVHNYTELFESLAPELRAHLGTGVTSIYGLGHGPGWHPPTAIGEIDFIDHPIQLFLPNTSYWQDAWAATLATAPKNMAAVVLADLARNANPNSNQSHPAGTGIVLLDYEPAYRPSWNFSTSARPDKLWAALLTKVHTPALDTNWTTLVGWEPPSSDSGGGWASLSGAEQAALMERSWNYFVKAYLGAGFDAVRKALPPATQLAVWDWPYKFGGSTAANASALAHFEAMTQVQFSTHLSSILPDVLSF